MESKSQKGRCAVGEYTYYVFSTAEGKAGFLCRSADPSPWEKGTVNYVN